MTKVHVTSLMAGGKNVHHLPASCSLGRMKFCRAVGPPKGQLLTKRSKQQYHPPANQRRLGCGRRSQDDDDETDNNKIREGRASCYVTDHAKSHPTVQVAFAVAMLMDGGNQQGSYVPKLHLTFLGQHRMTVPTTNPTASLHKRSDRWI